VLAAGAGKVNEYDAHDQSGFNAFSESDKKSREQRKSRASL
jgi:hypothetical protein